MVFSSVTYNIYIQPDSFGVEVPVELDLAILMLTDVTQAAVMHYSVPFLL